MVASHDAVTDYLANTGVFMEVVAVEPVRIAPTLAAADVLDEVIVVRAVAPRAGHAAAGDRAATGRTAAAADCHVCTCLVYGWRRSSGLPILLRRTLARRGRAFRTVMQWRLLLQNACSGDGSAGNPIVYDVPGGSWCCYPVCEGEPTEPPAPATQLPATASAGRPPRRRLPSRRPPSRRPPSRPSRRPPSRRPPSRRPRAAGDPAGDPAAGHRAAGHPAAGHRAAGHRAAGALGRRGRRRRRCELQGHHGIGRESDRREGGPSDVAARLHVGAEHGEQPAGVRQLPERQQLGRDLLFAAGRHDGGLLHLPPRARPGGHGGGATRRPVGALEGVQLGLRDDRGDGAVGRGGHPLAARRVHGRWLHRRDATDVHGPRHQQRARVAGSQPARAAGGLLHARGGQVLRVRRRP